jgi:hypothetical protein
VAQKTLMRPVNGCSYSSQLVADLRYSQSGHENHTADLGKLVEFGLSYLCE